jgi:hypothetical protein
MLSVVFNYIADEDAAQRMADPNQTAMSVKGLFALLKSSGLLQSINSLAPERCYVRSCQGLPLTLRSSLFPLPSLLPSSIRFFLHPVAPFQPRAL